MTSHALSAAAAMTGKPAGMPVASAAGGVISPSCPAGGTRSGSIRWSIGTACHFQSAVARPRQSLCSRRARSRPGSPPNPRNGRSADRSDSRRGRGICASSPRSPAGGCESSWLRLRPAGRRPSRTSRADRRASPHGPPTGFSPSVRRWSSQTMAGRSGCAVAVHVDDGGALGGQGDAGDGLFGDGRLLPELLARLAERLPEVVGVLFGPAGARRRRARWARGLCRRGCRAGRR